MASRLLLALVVAFTFTQFASSRAHAHSHHDHNEPHSHSHSHSHSNSHSHTSSFTLSYPSFLPTDPSKAAITASLLVSSASLISLALLPLQPALPLLLPFAAGALLSDLFLHLLPHTPPSFSMLYSLSFFFIFDCLLRRLAHTSAAYINLLADALHNFCDGLAIAAAFLSGPVTGITTTAAIILHELPQELADYAVLLRAGFSKRKALVANFVCALTALLGTAVALKAAQLVDGAQQVINPIAAAALMYMTFVNVIPDVVEDVNRPVKGNERIGWLLFCRRVIIALLAGAAGVWVVTLVEQVHDHGH